MIWTEGLESKEDKVSTPSLSQFKTIKHGVCGVIKGLQLYLHAILLTSFTLA